MQGILGFHQYCEGYKDKGFNVKVRLKKEGLFPAIAVGLMDFAGTGRYSGEYIVSSYGINNLDMHLGIGWGKLGGSLNKLTILLDTLKRVLKTRPGGYESLGGN